MRNLKRALSLGLTAAMISGLMVMGSSAVSYPDSDQIQNQTAVEILGEIGVMVGDDNGNFNPTQDVTRAEMAVIITRILYGNDLNVDQFKGMNLFTDVPAWAEGFVNLCASLDIVAGVGDGKFAPNETVTAAQAALMLSRALGYFQNNAEFGNDWALAAIRRATSAGIIGDDMVLAANEGLSRDNVAQMTFNTLTKAVPVQYNELLNVYYNENQGITYALTFNYLQTLGYTNFDLVYDNGDTTIYGRPATTWGIGSYRTTTSDKDSGSRYDEALDANGGLISSNVQILSRDEIITVANEPTYTYTDGTAEEDIYDDLGAVICNDQRGQEDDEMYTWTVYVNGEEVFTGEENNRWNPWNRENSIPEDNEGDTYQYTGDGAQTEIYVDDADQTVTVVEINYYLGQVSNVDEEDGTVSIREVSDLSDDNAELDDRNFATTAFEEDDYVVFTIDQNEDEDFYICEMMAPETVTGTVTRVNKNADDADAYLYLDRETKYDYSDIGHMVYDLNDANVPAHPELDEEYTLYLDPNGFVLAYSGDTEVGFLYVQDSDEELADWEARVVLADGTDDVIMVKDELKDENKAAVNQKDDDIDWLTFANDDAFKAYKAMFDYDEIDGYAWPDVDELTAFNEIRSKISEIDYQIWEYTTNDEGDLYTLTGRTTKYATGVEINNGKAYIDDPTDNDDVLIDNSTIFVDVDANVAYTGYDEVPDISNANIAYVLEDDNSRDVAEIVYIIDGDIYDADAMYFVITSHDRDTEKYDGDNYWEFEDMYVDGRRTSGLYVAYDALNAAEDMPEVGEVYKVMKSIDGTYITEIQHVDTWNEVESVTNSALWVENQNQNGEDKYVTNGDTIYVMIEEQYDANRDGWFTDLERTFDVSEVTYRDIQEDLAREDNYITLAQVVKTDDGIAELVYIWRFVPLTVNVTDNLGNEYPPEYVRAWWNDVNDPVTIGYEAPANYTITEAEVSNVWGATKSVLVGDKIVIDVDELLPYIRYSWDAADESIVISLTVNVDLEPVTASVQLDNATAEGKKVTMSGDAAINVTKGATVTLTPADGYRIDNVTSATGDINWGLNLDGTVTVTVQPSATNVYLNVKVATIEYKLTNISNSEDASINGAKVNDIFTVEDEKEVTITAKNPSNTQLNVTLSGDAKWTVNEQKSINGSEGKKSEFVTCEGVEGKNTWNMMMNLANHKDSKLYNADTNEVATEPAWDATSKITVYYYEEAPVEQVLVGTISDVTSDFTMTVGK